jgi:hypothetical protein
MKTTAIDNTTLGDRLRNLLVQFWPLDKLIPYARNARTHTEEQVAQVAASIAEFGWTNPILVGADGIIIAGHARLAAARKLNMTEVPVIVLDHLSDTQRRALVLADNRLALSAGWDEDMLRVELESLKEDAFDLDLVGFSDDEIEEILTGDQSKTGLTDDDDAPEPEETATTVAGDVWVLGEHRLLCGDATVLTDVEKVLAGGLADMVFTDPPYNINYEGRTEKKLKIKNDALGSKFYDFLKGASANMLSVCKGAVYICMSSSELHTIRQAFLDAGGHWSGIIIWVKNHFTLGWGDYGSTRRRCSYRAGSASEFDGARTQIRDLGEILVEGRERRKDSQQGFRGDGFHDELVALLAHYGVLAGQFKTSRNAHCLVPPVLK